MAIIKVYGSETTVKIVESTREDGETVYGLTCDKGAWCPRLYALEEVKMLSLDDVINEAEIHADMVNHS